MKRALLASAALAASFITPTFAAEPARPCSAAGDPRVRCADYHPDRVIILQAEVGGTLLIEIPDGERVVAVPTSDNALMRGATGPSSRVLVDPDDSGDSRGTTDRSLAVAVRSPTVTIKPNVALVPQPFFIVTEREGKQVRYRFELSTVPPGMGYYSLRLRNVASEQAERRARWQAGAAERATQQASAALAQTAAEPCRSTPGVNRRYMGQGDAALAPSEICDDGHSTFMRFPGSQRVPMVTTTLPDGRLAQVNTSMGANGWVTVHGTAAVLRLDDGGRQLCLLNRAYGTVGTNPGTGTISADVVRDVRLSQ